MKREQRLLNLRIAFVLIAALMPSIGRGAILDAKPKADDPADHTFPALGASAQPKVRVEWNRFHDHAGLGSILARLNKEFPDLAKVYSIGKSVQGRDLWCLEVTARNVGNPDRKAAMWIDGNIHGNEVQGGEVVAYTAWYLCHQYGRLPKVTELLDNYVFYLVPSINPDGRDRFFHAQSPSTRSGARPYDDDRDGLFDEDDVEDINGDGVITQMRIKDPNGRYKPHPDYPKYLMVRAKDDEKGEYTLLGWEGIDNDADGRINEDGVGGYDANRNWPWDWQPNYIQSGSLEYPACLPETRAIIEFVLAHPNIAAMQSYHNSGGMILRSPGRAGGAMRPEDDRILAFIAARGEKMIPYYRSMITYRDLYTVWGGEHDWFYAARGVLGFTNELWTGKNLYKTGTAPTDEEEAQFIEYVLLNDGVVEWKEFNHPTVGKIEIGGLKKEWGRTPTSFLLEEECHRNMAFTLYHAAMMPQLKITEVTMDKMADGLYNVWVAIENPRLIPTRTAQDVANHIGPPDIVSLAGPQIKVLSAGRVTDRFFKKVEAVKRRPERVELDTIPGMRAERVQFIVKGSGEFTVMVDSAKGGPLTAKRTLP
jgi:hypothetical protein